MASDVDQTDGRGAAPTSPPPTGRPPPSEAPSSSDTETWRDDTFLSRGSDRDPGADSLLLAPTASDVSRLPSSDLFLDPETAAYTKGRVLGSGSFGTVYLGLNQRSGQLVAIKEVVLPTHGSSDAAPARLKALAHEIRVLERLSHPNIVRYLGLQRLPIGVAIFMEYIPGGSIASLLRQFGPFAEPLVCAYISQALLGLDYLHREGILHRDIKGGNILVSDKGKVLLADFGSAKALHDVLMCTSAKHSAVGTIDWMAPEMITGGTVAKASDIWSLGCVALEMVYAGSPWSRNEIKVAGLSAMYYIGSDAGAVPHVPTDLLSPEACGFLHRCLQRDPTARAEAPALLQHPWIRTALPVEHWAHYQAAAIRQHSPDSGVEGIVPPSPRGDPPASEPTSLSDQGGDAPDGGLPPNGLVSAAPRRRPGGSFHLTRPFQPSGAGPPLEALLREVPDPTHRELGLFRVLVNRMERGEAHLSQRLEVLERLAAKYTTEMMDPSVGLAVALRPPTPRSGPEPLGPAPSSSEAAGDDGPTRRPTAPLRLWPRSSASRDARTQPDDPRAASPTAATVARWRAERVRVRHTLVAWQRCVVVVGQLLPLLLAFALWQFTPAPIHPAPSPPAPPSE